MAAAIASMALPAAGCGDQSSDEAQAAQSDAAAAGEASAEAKPKGDGLSPKQVAEALMAAMVARDQDKLNSMATAQTVNAGALLADAPPGVRFAVGDVEMIGEDNAHVAAAWYYPNGNDGEDRVMTMWMLRREPEGFRVYGSVMVVPELAAYNGGKIVFDFEDSEQVAAEEERVHALLEKIGSNKSAAELAENPEIPSGVRRQ